MKKQKSLRNITSNNSKLYLLIAIYFLQTCSGRHLNIYVHPYQKDLRKETLIHLVSSFMKYLEERGRLGSAI